MDMGKNGPTFKCGGQESGVKKANQETSLLLKLIISKTDEIWDILSKKEHYISLISRVGRWYIFFGGAVNYGP